MDVLKIAVAEVGNLSERRFYRLTTGSLSQRLPSGLAWRDRPELGMMLPQTTAAALVSENKSLAWPASVDSIPTCEDQEDIVAMSTTAARRAREMVVNARRVVAIELLGAAHALAYRRTENPQVQFGAGTRLALSHLDGVLHSGQQRTPSEDIAAVEELLCSGALLSGGPDLHAVGACPS